MLKKPASQIVTFEEKEEQWEQVVKPVEKWGKIVNKWDIEVRYAGPIRGRGARTAVLESHGPTHILDFHVHLVEQ